MDCIISYSVPPLNPKPKTKTFSDLKEKSPRMKVTSPSLSIVSLVGASGGRRFLPVEAAAVSAIRGGGGRVEDNQNVKEEQQQKFRRVIPENDDRGGGKAKVVARAKGELFFKASKDSKDSKASKDFKASKDRTKSYKSPIMLKGVKKPKAPKSSKRGNESVEMECSMQAN